MWDEFSLNKWGNVSAYGKTIFNKININIPPGRNDEMYKSYLMCKFKIHTQNSVTHFGSFILKCKCFAFLFLTHFLSVWNEILIIMKVLIYVYFANMFLK